MATKKHSGNAHRGDPDRLFARPITKHIGAFSSLNRDGGLEYLREPKERHRLMDHLAFEEKEGPRDEGTRAGIELARRAISELEAFDVIERVRKAARHG